MSNQYRVEQDRDVICVVDIGRLMGAPILDRTRLDVALDVVAAVALVADELGDRCGVVAFDTQVRRRVSPRRSGGRAVVRAIFDLEPTSVDSDYELAFRSVRSSKRALVLVMTDLLDEGAARPLVEAVPLLARKHAVVIASVADPDLRSTLEASPVSTVDAYEKVAALDVLQARTSASLRLKGAGAEVIDAPSHQLPAACIGSYLRAKARALL